MQIALALATALVIAVIVITVVFVWSGPAYYQEFQTKQSNIVLTAIVLRFVHYQVFCRSKV